MRTKKIIFKESPKNVDIEIRGAYLQLRVSIRVIVCISVFTFNCNNGLKVHYNATWIISMTIESSWIIICKNWKNNLILKPSAIFAIPAQKLVRKVALRILCLVLCWVGMMMKCCCRFYYEGWFQYIVGNGNEWKRWETTQ